MTSPTVSDSAAHPLHLCIRTQAVARRLSRIAPSIEDNPRAWEYLRDLEMVFVETERRERNVCVLDPVDVAVNTFHVTDEFRFNKGGQHPIRVDVILVVNGVPAVIVKAKAATRRWGIDEALIRCHATSARGRN